VPGCVIAAATAAGDGDAWSARDGIGSSRLCEAEEAIVTRRRAQICIQLATVAHAADVEYWCRCDIHFLSILAQYSITALCRPGARRT